MNNKKLAICPCGKTPKKLFITDNGQGMKWASASGDCCGEWSVEFRTGYRQHDSNECMELAIDAWNDAPRATTPNQEPQRDREPQCTCGTGRGAVFCEVHNCFTGGFVSGP